MSGKRKLLTLLLFAVVALCAGLVPPVNAAPGGSSGGDTNPVERAAVEVAPAGSPEGPTSASNENADAAVPIASGAPATPGDVAGAASHDVTAVEEGGGIGASAGAATKATLDAAAAAPVQPVKGSKDGSTGGVLASDVSGGTTAVATEADQSPPPSPPVPQQPQELQEEQQQQPSQPQKEEEAPIPGVGIVVPPVAKDAAAPSNPVEQVPPPPLAQQQQQQQEPLQQQVPPPPPPPQQQQQQVVPPPPVPQQQVPPPPVPQQQQQQQVPPAQQQVVPAVPQQQVVPTPPPPQQQQQQQQQQPQQPQKKIDPNILKINYALKEKGADVLENTEKADGASNLLMNAKDKYLIVPCHEKLFVVIQLSEDIMMAKFVIANYEKYSSTVKDFQVFGSLNYPTSEWRHLGDFTAMSAQGDQQFGLRSSVRYLKFKFLTHHGAEHFCTLSQIKVHGTTAVAAAHNDIQVAQVELKEIETLIAEGEELKQIMQELGDDDFDEDEDEEEEEEKAPEPAQVLQVAPPQQEVKAQEVVASSEVGKAVSPPETGQILQPLTPELPLPPQQLQQQQLEEQGNVEGVKAEKDAQQQQQSEVVISDDEALSISAQEASSATAAGVPPVAAATSGNESAPKETAATQVGSAAGAGGGGNSAAAAVTTDGGGEVGGGVVAAAPAVPAVGKEASIEATTAVARQGEPSGDAAPPQAAVAGAGSEASRTEEMSTPSAAAAAAATATTGAASEGASEAKAAEGVVPAVPSTAAVREKSAPTEVGEATDAAATGDAVATTTAQGPGIASPPPNPLSAQASADPPTTSSSEQPLEEERQSADQAPESTNSPPLDGGENATAAATASSVVEGADVRASSPSTDTEPHGKREAAKPSATAAVTEAVAPQVPASNTSQEAVNADDASATAAAAPPSSSPSMKSSGANSVASTSAETVSPSGDDGHQRLSTSGHIDANASEAMAEAVDESESSGQAALPSSPSRLNLVPDSASLAADGISSTDINDGIDAHRDEVVPNVVPSALANGSGQGEVASTENQTSVWASNGSLLGEAPKKNPETNASTEVAIDATPSGELSRSEKLQAGIDSAVQAVTGLLNDLVHPSTTVIPAANVEGASPKVEVASPLPAASEHDRTVPNVTTGTVTGAAEPSLSSSTSAALGSPPAITRASINAEATQDNVSVNGTTTGAVVTATQVTGAPATNVKSAMLSTTSATTPVPSAEGGGGAAAATAPSSSTSTPTQDTMPAATTSAASAGTPASSHASPPPPAAGTSEETVSPTSSSPSSTTLVQQAAQPSQGIAALASNSAAVPPVDSSASSSNSSSTVLSAASSATSPPTTATASPTKKLEACLKTLNFTKFKARYKTKLDAHFAAKRGEDLEAGSKQLKRFDEVMNEKLKSLETSNFILETYMEKMHNCYKSLMEDLRDEHRVVRGNVEKAWKDAAVELAGMHRKIDEETPAGDVLKGELRSLRSGAAVVHEKVSDAARWASWASAAVIPSICLVLITFLLLFRQHRALRAMERRIEEMNVTAKKPGVSSSDASRAGSTTMEASSNPKTGAINDADADGDVNITSTNDNPSTSDLSSTVSVPTRTMTSSLSESNTSTSECSNPARPDSVDTPAVQPPSMQECQLEIKSSESGDLPVTQQQPQQDSQKPAAHDEERKAYQ